MQLQGMTTIVLADLQLNSNLTAFIFTFIFAQDIKKKFSREISVSCQFGSKKKHFFIYVIYVKIKLGIKNRS